jgi:hypothetical protein
MDVIALRHCKAVFNTERELDCISNPMLGIVSRYQNGDERGHSEVRGQRSEDGRQMAEIRGQRSDSNKLLL